MKKWKRMVALFLVAALLLIPGAFQTSAEDKNESSFSENVVESKEEGVLQSIPNPDWKGGTPVREVISEREENVKHFDLGYGTYQAVMYGRAVHRKSENGEWVDIDNNLYADRASGLYATKDQRISFAEKYSPDQPLFTLFENGYLISMSLVSSSALGTSGGKESSPAKVENAPEQERGEEWSSIEEAMEINNTASITYPNVAENIDLQYLLSGNDVKENIIVRSPSEGYSYSFELNTQGLVAVKNKNGSISLLDAETKKIAYVFPAPYMYDANGDVSHSVEYMLTAKSKNTYILNVVADAKWMNDGERAYPIVIDPTVREDGYYDTYINENYPEDNYGLSDELWVATDCITFIKTNALPSLPTGSQFYSAELSVYYYYYSNVTSGLSYITASQVASDWEEADLTWDIASENSGMGICGDPMSVAVFNGSIGAYYNSPKRAVFNVTEAFADFYEDPTMNFGIALQYVTGSNTSAIMCSYDSDGDYVPYFTVVYTASPIASRVYRIKNVGLNKYLTVEGSSAESGAAVKMEAAHGTSSSSPVDQLFKVTFVKAYGSDQLNYYTIRPMTNSALGLSAGFTGGDRTASVEQISYTEQWENLLFDHLWAINKVNSYSTIQNGRSSDNSHLGITVDDDGNSIVSTRSTSLSTDNVWLLEPYTGSLGDHLQLTSSTNSIFVCDTFDFDAYMSSPRIGVNGPISYSVTNTDETATDKAIVNASSGLVETLRPGAIRLWMTYTGMQRQWYHDIWIDSMEGTYFFRNMKFGKYMQIDDDVEDEAVSETEAIFEILSFDASNRQKWILEYVEDGYYKIKSVASGLVATAPSEENSAVYQTNYTGGYHQQWSFVATDDGYYKITPRQYPEYYLSAGSGIITAEGRNVEIREEQEDLKDVWQVDKVSQHAHLSYNARILYDETAMELLSESEMRQCYENAAARLFRKFHIQLNLQSVSYEEDLNLSDECHAEGLGGMCTEECAPNHFCYLSHHKGASRLIDLHKSNSEYTCRIVGYSLCCIGPAGAHVVCLGVGDMNQKNTAVTAYYPELDSEGLMQAVENTILHELSHNFGASHLTCQETMCVLVNDALSSWCSTCSAAIKENYE